MAGYSSGIKLQMFGPIFGFVKTRNICFQLFNSCGCNTDIFSLRSINKLYRMV